MNKLFRADLHCHSYFSDGSDSPQTLIEKAKKIGLCGLSITDHDTVEAYLNLGSIDFPLITGVEFSSFFDGEPVHILGYAIDPWNKGVQELCEWHKTRRENRNRSMIFALNELGFSLSYDELLSGSEKKNQTIGRPHIAQLLIKHGVVDTIQQAFERYLGEDKPGYVAGAVCTPDETISVIHGAGGAAVLAHPHLIKSKRKLRKILQAPFDGMEGYYARFSKEKERPLLLMAKERNLLITGGSDYHGETKPFNQLGSSWVDEATFMRLKEWSARS